MIFNNVFSYYLKILNYGQRRYFADTDSWEGEVSDYFGTEDYQELIHPIKVSINHNNSLIMVYILEDYLYFFF
jgi:hypothetical protein